MLHKAGYLAMLSGQTSPSEIIDRIESLNHELARFWKAAHGWAPMEAAGLLRACQGITARSDLLFG
jgi:hypothetical protein